MLYRHENVRKTSENLPDGGCGTLLKLLQFIAKQVNVTVLSLQIDLRGSGHKITIGFA